MKKVLVGVVLCMFLLPATSFAGEKPLKALKGANKSAAHHNDEGISHFNEGHWSVAIKHFKKAVEADKKFARGYFNLALALDMAGRHGAAADNFQKAFDLASDDKEVKNSKILRAHIGH